MTIDDIFTTFPILQTKRLILREPTLHDAAALFAVYGDPGVMKYLDAVAHTTPDETKHFIRQYHGWYMQRQSIRWAITLHDDDTVIGTCGFFLFDEGYRRAEMGYELHQAYWRQGIMSEALRTILAFGFDVMGFNRVEALPNDDNEKSKELLKKLGFTVEGVRRQRFFIADTYRDEHLFALLRADYQVTET